MDHGPTVSRHISIIDDLVKSISRIQSFYTNSIISINIVLGRHSEFKCSDLLGVFIIDNSTFSISVRYIIIIIKNYKTSYVCIGYITVRIYCDHRIIVGNILLNIDSQLISIIVLQILSLPINGSSNILIQALFVDIRECQTSRFVHCCKEVHSIHRVHTDSKVIRNNIFKPISVIWVVSIFLIFLSTDKSSCLIRI